METGTKFKTLEFGLDIWGDRTMIDKWWEVVSITDDIVVASMVYSNEKYPRLKEIRSFSRKDLLENVMV